MRNAFFGLLAVACASAVHAEDLAGVTPQDLQRRAAEAVTADDEGKLMDVMREMQRREMLFFRVPESTKGPECKREPETIGVLTKHPARRGTARQAYFTFLREEAVETSYCGCTTAQMTYSDFTKKKFDTTPEGMSEAQYQAMNDYLQEAGAPVLERYSAFFAANCRGE